MLYNGIARRNGAALVSAATETMEFDNRSNVTLKQKSITAEAVSVALRGIVDPFGMWLSRTLELLVHVGTLHGKFTGTPKAAALCV